MRVSRSIALAAAAAALSACVSACTGTSPESPPGSTASPGSTAGTRTLERSPAGETPGNQVFVEYAAPSGVFSVRVPRGWARTRTADAVTFTDRLSSVRVEQIPYGSASTEASFRSDELPNLRRSTPGFRLRKVGTVALPAGPAVVAEYTRTAAAPDPVTGKAVEQAVARYELWHADQRVVLTLTRPRGTGDAGPWRTVTRSFRWRR
jgi:hypothetical protein